MLSSRRGEELLRKRCGLDSPKPSVNLEDPALISKLFHLFQGSPEPQAASTTQPAAAAATAVADSHVLPAGVMLQSRLMSLFTKSLAAANHFPGTIQVPSLYLHGNYCELCLPVAVMLQHLDHVISGNQLA